MITHVGEIWIQISIALFGIFWKLKEGYGILYMADFMDISPLHPATFEPLNLLRCPDFLWFVSTETLASDWPYFALHLFLYLGQLFPLVLIILWESLLRGGSRIAFT